jgi:beta-lactamase regulating signal transducer with metallopeptidase domain|tara:strand:+ start:418 stop:564 length:147 start_codon:yes stop_codon:yes gene_type:complete
MDERLRIILIIIISVSIFGLIVFIIVRNYLKTKIEHLVEKEKNNKNLK